MSALSLRLSGDLPACLATAAVWRGDALGRPVTASLPSGFGALDAALPGGGWPGFGLTELLQTPVGALEFRLLGPTLGRVCAAGRCVALVGPPHGPHLPGLLPHGITARQLVWVQAATPAERLWATEQLIKAGSCGGPLRLSTSTSNAQSAPGRTSRRRGAAEDSRAASAGRHSHTGPSWALASTCSRRSCAATMREKIRVASGTAIAGP